MAASYLPLMIQTPRVACVSISTANTNRDGTGTIGTLWLAGTNLGSNIANVVIQAAGSTTAGVIRLFIYDGTNYFLFKEQLVTAITPSTTVEAFRAILDFSQAQSGLYLPVGYSLRVATNNAETFKVFAIGGDY